MKSFVKESLGVTITILLLIAIVASFIADVLVVLGVFLLPVLKGAAMLEKSAGGLEEAIWSLVFLVLFLLWLGVWLTGVTRFGPRTLRFFLRIFDAVVRWCEKRELLAFDLLRQLTTTDDC